MPLIGESLDCNFIYFFYQQLKALLEQYFYFLLLLDIISPFELAYIWNYFEILKMKGQDNLQKTTVNINLYRLLVNIYWNSWTKFPLNNRQPSKSVKINGQLSKLHPMETIK